MVHFRDNFYMTVYTFYGGIFTCFIVESQRLFMLKLSHFSVANSVILHTLYLLNFTTFRLYSVPYCYQPDSTPNHCTHSESIWCNNLFRTSNCKMTQRHGIYPLHVCTRMVECQVLFQGDLTINIRIQFKVYGVWISFDFIDHIVDIYSFSLFVCELTIRITLVFSVK